MGLFARLQRKLLFARYAVEPTPGAAPPIPGLEQGWLETAAGRVERWFVPGRGVSAAAPGPVALLAHGNAEVIGQQAELIQGYCQLGVSCLQVEYRGYGRSAGSPSQAAIGQDLRAAYTELLGRPEVDPTRLVFHGRSLGTGVVCDLAAAHPPTALVLISPFTSMMDMMARFLVPRFLVADPFDNARVLQTLKAPVLLIHGRHDELIPFEHAERLARLAPPATLRTLCPYPCGHNDVPIHSARFWRDIRRHLQGAGVLPRGPGGAEAAEADEAAEGTTGAKNAEADEVAEGTTGTKNAEGTEGAKNAEGTEGAE
jgi:hypothetical protein